MRYTILILILIFSGCSATKSVDKTKKETKTEIDSNIDKQGTRITRETQEGGNTSIPIIPIKERERNEIGELKEMISELKDKSVTGRVIYHKDGSAECECNVEALQREIIDLYKEREETRSKKDEFESSKKKDEGFKISDAVILSIMGVIVLLGALVIFLMFKKIDASSKAFHLALDKLLK